MILTGLAALLAAGAAAPAPLQEERVEYAQLTIRQRIIIRVPMRRLPTAPAPPPVVLEARKAAKCQSAEGMAAAVVMRADIVDFIYRGGRRIRAELEEACPSLDFDAGFYMVPTRDRRICAGRDVIRARAGGECPIKRFRTLVPARAVRTER